MIAILLAFALACPASVYTHGADAPLPGNLTLRHTPRPWGKSFLPRSKAPARKLEIVDLAQLTPDERKAIFCLQALTSRTQPSIWVINSTKDRCWLDWHIQKRYVDGGEIVADPLALFSKYAHCIKGAVIPDPDLYRGDTLAANVAACEDLIVATPELAQRLGLPIAVDLRHRFASYADGLQWVWATYKSRLSHHLCDIAPVLKGASVYSMQWRAVIFWPCGPLDATKPGADMIAEKHIVAQILSELEPNTGMLGFPSAGKGVGLGETNGVGLSSRYGVSLVCSDNLLNTSVTSGVPLRQLKQSPPLQAPKLERDKIYIALAISDGDNQNIWINFSRKYFEHPRFGEFPVAYGMGPAIMDLQPAVAQWYYEKGGPQTEFFSDVSGIGYMQPHNYGQGYKIPAAILDGFLDWTRLYLAAMDMKTVRTVGGEDNMLAVYDKRIPGLHSLFADMGRYGSHAGIANLTYSLPTGEPVFRAVTSWRYGKEGFLPEVREQVGDTRPAFVNGFLHCWTFNMDAITAIYDQRDADMVFVTPEQLSTLYRKAKARNWTK
ncbi:MAG: hypothetical protein ACFUZC_17420 [Chthoniobacteraceae bacterium]